MDIKDYQFADTTIKAAHSSKRSILFFLEDTTFVIEKKDVVALAKHFKLTSDDLTKHNKRG